MTCFACNAAMPNAATDAQIDRRSDRLVYALYDLTDEEIAIVEGATA